jgi:hypothetical protein
MKVWKKGQHKHRTSFDEYHAYLFNKESLLRWWNGRPSFGEAVELLGVSSVTLHRWMTEGRIVSLDEMGGSKGGSQGRIS